MQLIEVNNPKLAKAFIQVNVNHYSTDANYIRPIDKDVENIFNPLKNKLLKNGSHCIRWLLADDAGKYIGRIAAFVNHKTFDKQDQPTGGFGFFDCINDQNAANTLLSASKTWLLSHNMEAMDGPINFGDRDRFWGLLVDNFGPPSYLVNYNYPYYQALLENFGLQNYFNQYTYYRLVDDRLSDEYYQSAEKILTNPDYSFEHIKVKNLSKYAEDFRQIYNAGWAKFEGVREMPYEQAQKVFKSIKPIIDERILWFAYHKGQPVAFFLGIPEMNTIFKHVNGKLDFIGKLKVLYHKYIGTCKTMYGVAFGVTPEHQGLDLERALNVAASRVVQNKGLVKYHDFIMTWIGDFNPKIMTVAERVGGKIFKTHTTYRMLFDSTKEFKRAKKTNLD